MQESAPARIAPLDLIRGIAVLGILAVNIMGFAGPTAAIYSPHALETGSLADEALFALTLVVFEGKMRALFCLLFGASLVLFVEKHNRQGRNGLALQLHRLCWLALFGYLHFLLFWWGDILFLYAIVGIVALFLTILDTRIQLALALLIFTAWQASGVSQDLPLAHVEASQIVGLPVTPSQTAQLEKTAAKRSLETEKEMSRYQQGFIAQAKHNLTERALYPVAAVIYSFGETLPFMLFGMVLLRTGFFTGEWSRQRLKRFSFTSLAVGGSITVAFACWSFAHHFPEQIMRLAINSALGFPHLLMALGYAGLFVLSTPHLLRTRIGRRIASVGKMALSNYVGTSVVMTAIFYGWGFGLIGKVTNTGQYLFVLLGWALMLVWSKPWLERFGQGPLERVWRNLTKMRQSETI